MEIITFYTKATGSSHIESGKGCQDNGTVYNENGVSIAVVCDGHGGESYVRSETGSFLAAEITKEKILEFIENTPKELFNGKLGAVTVVPTTDPLLDKLGKIREKSELSETELELLKQNIFYFNETESIKDIESSFRNLFHNIWQSWLNAIQKDVDSKPFSPSEIEKLGPNRHIRKAYGCTLIAAVRTPDYWFAFQIGDGKLFMCDELMQWSEPVPWDCNCFLNLTTSLCDKDPVNEFRYAFNGTGSFPIAFTLGSDGIDDTFIKIDLIQKFYSNLLCVFNEYDQGEAEELLKKSLSSLSKKGSHDDMSVAAIIDKEKLPKAIEYYKIISEVRGLTAERNEREEYLHNLEAKISQLKSLIEETSSIRDDKARNIRNWWLKVCQRKKSELEECKALSDKLFELRTELNSLVSEFENSRLSFVKWKEKNRSRVHELRELAHQLTQSETSAIQETVEIKVEIKEDEKSIASDEKTPSELTETKEDESETDDNRTIFSEDTSDDQDTFINKAESAKMTTEDIAKMEQDSDTQINEILNNQK